MVKAKKSAGTTVRRKKPRVTAEEITEMQRLQREGYSVSAIARETKFHRQTVKMHLTEQKGDTVSIEAKGKVLAEDFRNHFRDFPIFTQTGLKSMLDASPLEHEKVVTRGQRKKGPISLAGLLGVPNKGSADYMSGEWLRLCRPPSKDKHLLRALREHTPGFRVWEPWDRWRKMVGEYETAGRAIVQHIEDKIESDLYEDVVDPGKMEAVVRWLFGNVLRLSIGMQPEGLEIFRKDIFDQGVIRVRNKDTDADGSAYLYGQLENIKEEIKGMPEFETLKTAAAELMSKDKQIEFRHIARDLDRELAVVELMRALPGQCFLCPV